MFPSSSELQCTIPQERACHSFLTPLLSVTLPPRQETIIPDVVALLPLSTPQLIAATEEDAIALVNRWLHREVGMALNASRATFHAETFCWHLPIHLAYGATGSRGIVGDVYVHAATGVFLGAPEAVDLQRRAEALATAHGITE